MRRSNELMWIQSCWDWRTMFQNGVTKNLQRNTEVQRQRKGFLNQRHSQFSDNHEVFGEVEHQDFTQEMKGKHCHYWCLWWSKVAVKQKLEVSQMEAFKIFMDECCEHSTETGM